MADRARILAGMGLSGRLIEAYYLAKWQFEAYAKGETSMSASDTALLVTDTQ
jgi:hypothetical protein